MCSRYAEGSPQFIGGLAEAKQHNISVKQHRRDKWREDNPGAWDDFKAAADKNNVTTDEAYHAFELILEALARKDGKNISFTGTEAYEAASNPTARVRGN